MSLIETNLRRGKVIIKPGAIFKCEMERFGEKLRQLRNNKKLTLKELAKKLGLTAHGYISEMEAGKKKPTTEIVLALSRLFEVSTDQLLKDELDIEI